MNKFDSMITEILGSSNFYSINKALRKKFVSLEKTAVFQEILSKISYYEDLISKDEDIKLSKYDKKLGIQYGFKEIEDDFGISYKTAKKFLDNFVNLNLLIVSKNGLPAKTWINIHPEFEENFKKLWEEKTPENTELENSNTELDEDNKHSKEMEKLELENSNYRNGKFQDIELENSNFHIQKNVEEREEERIALSPQENSQKLNPKVLPDFDIEDWNDTIPEFKSGYQKPKFEIYGKRLVLKLDDAYILSLTYDDAVDYFNFYVDKFLSLHDEKHSTDTDIQYATSLTMTTSEFERALKRRKPYTDTQFTLDLKDELGDGPHEYELIAKIKMKLQKEQVNYTPLLIQSAKKHRDYTKNKSSWMHWGGWINDFKNTYEKT